MNTKLTDLQITECGIKIDKIIKNIAKWMSKELEVIAINSDILPFERSSKNNASPKKQRFSKNESSALKLTSDEFIKKWEYVLSLISPEIENSPNREKEEDDYNQSECLKDNKMDLFYKMWISNNPILGQEINMLLEKAVKYMDTLLSIKIDENTSFELKIYLKKLQKATDVIIDGFRDLRKVVKFANSVNENSHMVMTILKIEYKYGIKTKMQAIESAKTSRPMSKIGSRLEVESNQMRLQRKKIKKYMEVIQKVAGIAESPKKHLERIGFAMEKSRKFNENTIDKSVRLASIDKDYQCKLFMCYH